MQAFLVACMLRIVLGTPKAGAKTGKVWQGWDPAPWCSGPRLLGGVGFCLRGDALGPA